MISPIKKSMKFATGLALSLLGSGLCMAQTDGGGFFEPQGGTVTAIKTVRDGSLGTNVTSLINYFLGFLGLVAVAFIIYGGVLTVTSAGEDEGIGKAKKIITYAAVGIVIIMLSYTIVTFVTGAL
jgi:hypothetical protein